MIYIAIIAVFALLASGVGYITIKRIKETEIVAGEKPGVVKTENAQGFLPFKKIEYGLIDIGENRFRAVIEVGSINYGLKSAKEKVFIESAFRKYLDSLTFPISFHIQTRVIDTESIIRSLSEDVKDTVKKYPFLEDYAEMYLSDMQEIGMYTGNGTEKKKFIIVPFDDAHSIGKLSELEMYEYASKELAHRTSILIEGLQAIGLKARILNNAEVLEMIYAALHKSDFSLKKLQSIAGGEFCELVIGGGDDTSLSIKERMERPLVAAYEQVRQLIDDDEMPQYLKEEYEEQAENLKKIIENIRM